MPVTVAVSTTASSARLPELGVELDLELVVKAFLDVGAQLVERLELRGRARKLVVERRQHLLLDLLDRNGDRCRARRA